MYIPKNPSPLEEVVAKKIKQPWDPDAIIISPLSTPASGFSIKRKRCIIDDPMDYVDIDTLSLWNLHDLTCAGKLLRKPPLPCHFDDEHEMRRVYSMIYDVYRCKFELLIQSFATHNFTVANIAFLPNVLHSFTNILQ